MLKEILNKGSITWSIVFIIICVVVVLVSI